MNAYRTLVAPILAASVLAAVTVGASFAEPELYDPDDIVPDTPYHVRGWLEHGRFLPSDMLFDMKLDSGALNTSMDAEIRAYYGPDGEAITEDQAEALIESGNGVPVVEFVVENEEERRVRARRDVVRFATIKGKLDYSIRRPVVEMAFCIAGVYVDGQVNLSDRGQFNYPVLIGRNMLKSANILIDSRESYTYKSHCTPPES
ncbi:MAG: RimK/LysX family protein [Pseudomonadota bacterium]